MFTEDEAKNIACCTGSNTPMTRGGCIGSSCMAWRWNEAKRTKAFVEAVQARIKEKSTKDKLYPHNKAIAEVYDEIGAKLTHTEGFCGLAGKP